ncbi:CTP synthase [Paramixta manurensis]|uniref:CTP synthase (glutamine hydrolyzing) n=1 Tax=Paramixta manurensis TaxID=2740817 RepID=A0A6M8UC61_9GAMM|nr:CTP synthase [Erwiniaceae bacterium PD-1]
MSLTFILDDAAEPARFGITASHWANQRRVPLWSLRPDFSGDYPDSHQHVIAAGYCVTSGLYRSETLVHEISDPARLPSRDAVVVLAARDAQRIAAFAGARLTGLSQGEFLTLLDHQQQPLLQLSSDAFGRWSTTRPAPIAPARQIHLGLVAREADQRAVYPAILAALGDAAGQINSGLTIHFLPPATLSADLAELRPLDAVLLPGGASMAAVAGQIRIAAATFTSGLPTLGLCLGMQSMATAAVQRSAGYQHAMLAEVAPAAALHSFIPFADARHRCGLLPFRANAALPGTTSLMHYNHRYHFNPALLPQLAASGVMVSAATGFIVDAISLPTHPFWHGVQGHPELLSSASTPPTLLLALLRAALSRPE